MDEKIPVPWNNGAIMAALAPVDEALRKSDWKWGVGRLERLVEPSTLESYRRGWVLWREALIHGRAGELRMVGPKMIAALAFMDREAVRLGHTPLSVETWEAVMEDGRILVVVRTTAEASAIAQAAGLGLDAMLPPDMTRVVRHQHEGRELLVWTMAELARVMPAFDVVNQIKRTWPGATVTRGATPGPVTGENDHVDWATGDEIRAHIEGVA